MEKIEAAWRTAEVEHALRDLVPLAEEEEARGKKVIYLNIGDPNVFDFYTPKHIIEAVVSRIDRREGYSNALGSREAREAILWECRRLNFKHVSFDDIILTVGGSEAIHFVLTALLNKTDEILLPSPGYSMYNAVLSFLGVKHADYYLDEDNRWQIDVDELKKKSK